MTLDELLDVHHNDVVYGLIDPRQPKRVMYVGCTNNPERRLHSHINRCTYGNSKRNVWMRRLLTDGVDPVMVILEQVAPGDDVMARERHWMELCRLRNPDLCNALPMPATSHDVASSCHVTGLDL
jgi:predicted GIY-YIG superfamily endonuclease